MTAQIIRLAPKADPNVTTAESILAACATLEALYATARSMREAVETMEAERVVIRSDLRTMLTRLADHACAVELAIMSSRITARYCESQLKEMGR